MSTLSNVSQALMESVFKMQNGYVLNFKSKSEFQAFVANSVRVDIENAQGYSNATSMAKKLRYFVKHETNDKVYTLLVDLLQRRDAWIEMLKESDEDFKDEFEDAVSDLKEELLQMNGLVSDYSSNEERLRMDLRKLNEILHDLHDCITSLLINHTYDWSKKENEYNDYIRDLFKAKGYTENKDQTRHGDSLNGKDAGEIDLLIYKEGKEIALIEAMKLDSVKTKTITEHFEKAVGCYNPLGTPIIIIAYVNIVDYVGFWKNYVSFIKSYDFKMGIIKPFEESTQPNAAMKQGMLILEKNDYAFPIVFITVKL